MSILTIPEPARVRSAKLQPICHHQQINIQFFTAVCPSCHPTNSVKALHEHSKRVHNQNEIGNTRKHPRNESNNTGFLDSKFSPSFGHFQFQTIPGSRGFPDEWSPRYLILEDISLQCFDTVGWMTGKASSL